VANPAVLDYPFSAPPEPGTVLEVCRGVRWLRMGLPFELDHINLWLLEDAGGWTIVDTGIGNAPTRALWERIFETALAGRPVRRVIVTHYHPDHAGNAAWLCSRFAVPLWMTRGEFLTVHAIHAGMASYTPEAAAALYRSNGLDEARVAARALTAGEAAVRLERVRESVAHFVERRDALRDRREDIPALIDRFWCAAMGESPAPSQGSAAPVAPLEPSSLNALAAAYWAGNLDHLQSVITNLALHTGDITPEFSGMSSSIRQRRQYRTALLTMDRLAFRLPATTGPVPVKSKVAASLSMVTARLIGVPSSRDSMKRCVACGSRAIIILAFSAAAAWMWPMYARTTSRP